jgi:integrase
MPRRKSLPFVETWRDRHGKVRFYFRRGKGKRIALPDSFGSDEFHAAYAAALHGATDNPTRPGIEKIKPGSLAALIVSYKKSSQFRDLRATTRTAYAGRMDIIRRAHGHRSVSGLTRDRIEIILQGYDEKPGAKLFTLKMLRVLIRHAIRIGWLTADPSLGISRPKGGEIRSWTEAEVVKFEKHWPLGTRQRTAFALHLFTGQRRSDVHRMTWADIEGQMIRVIQQKTGHKLSIPLHRELKTALAAADRSHMAIITTEYGRPFTVDGYSQWLRDAIKAAGLPLDAQPHGLRKAAGRRMAEAGCTPHEIMAILGHKTLSEAERYTREADQHRLAQAAVIKLEGQTKNKASPNRVSKFGKIPKTTRKST